MYKLKRQTGDLMRKKRPFLSTRWNRTNIILFSTGADCKNTQIIKYIPPMTYFIPVLVNKITKLYLILLIVRNQILLVF